MRRPLLILTLLLAGLVSTSQAVEIEVTSWPPGLPLGPGVSAMITAHGVAPGQAYTWLRVPKIEGDAIFKTRGEDDTPVVFFAGVKPGPRTFLLVLERPGLDDILQRDFEYGKADPPNPPDPPDPPPPPTAEWQVAIFHQSDWLDNAPQPQRDMISGRKFRDALTAAGHRYVGGFDIDAVARSGQGTCSTRDCLPVELPDSLRPWWDAVSGRGMPVLAIAPTGGGTIRVFALPSSADDLFRLLKEQR